MPGPKDGFLYDLTPAQLISWVAKVTLAGISNMTTQELIRIGWYNNPVVDILYSMTSAGVWTARTDSSGDIIADGELVDKMIFINRKVGTPTISRAENWVSQLIPGIGVKEITLSNGASANNPLVAALSGYYGVIQIKGIYSDSAVDSNTVALDFEDEDDTDLHGAPATMTVPCIATAISKDMEDIVMWGTAEYKAIEVDVDTGGGAGDNGKKIYLKYLYWYET